jgi:hypothetical protein
MKHIFMALMAIAVLGCGPSAAPPPENPQPEPEVDVPEKAIEIFVWDCELGDQEACGVLAVFEQAGERCDAGDEGACTDFVEIFASLQGLQDIIDSTPCYEPCIDECFPTCPAYVEGDPPCSDTCLGVCDAKCLTGE